MASDTESTTAALVVAGSEQERQHELARIYLLDALHYRTSTMKPGAALWCCRCYHILHGWPMNILLALALTIHLTIGKPLMIFYILVYLVHDGIAHCTGESHYWRLFAIVVTVADSAITSDWTLSKLLAPILLVSYASGSRKFVISVFRSFPEMFPYLCITATHVVLFGVAGHMMYAQDMADKFSSTADSIVSMLVLLSSANYPDVMMPAYHANRANSAFFVSFLFLGNFFCLKLLLASSYTALARSTRLTAAETLALQTESLTLFFRVVADPEGPANTEEQVDGDAVRPAPTITAEVFIGHLQACRPGLSQDEGETIFGLADHSGAGRLDLDTFLDVGDHLGLELIDADSGHWWDIIRFRLMPTFRNLTITSFAVFYMWGVVGNILFGGLITGSQEQRLQFAKVNPSLAAAWADNFYYELSFNDWLASFNTMFALTVVNNWHVIMGGYATILGNEFMKIFFIVFFVTIAILTVNLITCLLIDEFTLSLFPRREVGRPAALRNLQKPGLIIRRPLSTALLVVERLRYEHSLNRLHPELVRRLETMTRVGNV